MSRFTRDKRQARRWAANPESLSNRFSTELDKGDRLWKGWLHVPVEWNVFGVPNHHLKRPVLLHKGGKP